jgi:hypothetical protein
MWAQMLYLVCCAIYVQAEIKAGLKAQEDRDYAIVEKIRYWEKEKVELEEAINKAHNDPTDRTGWRSLCADTNYGPRVRQLDDRINNLYSNMKNAGIQVKRPDAHYKPNISDIVQMINDDFSDVKTLIESAGN